jgi:exodeoxyribonuclease VII small subunit
MKKPADMTFKELMKELDALSNEIDDELDVDSALISYERGTKIIAELSGRIDSAEQKIKKIQS